MTDSDYLKEWLPAAFEVGSTTLNKVSSKSEQSTSVPLTPMQRFLIVVWLFEMGKVALLVTTKRNATDMCDVFAQIRSPNHIIPRLGQLISNKAVQGLQPRVRTFLCAIALCQKLETRVIASNVRYCGSLTTQRKDSYCKSRPG